MGVVSGIGGAVNGHDTVRTWQITYESDNQDYRASNTLGGTGRVAGNKDWSGSFTFYGHTPGVMPGETFTFTGYGAESASGQAIVDSIEINCDIEGGGIIEGTVNFSADGALTLAAGTGSDATTPNPPSSIGCKVAFDSSDLSDVRSWSLTISADNREYRSSSTSGNTRRVKGAIDASGSIEVYTDDLTDLPAPGSVKLIDLFVNTSDSWNIKWGIIDSVEPEVDIESGDPVGATINWSFTGFNAGSAGGITQPGDDPSATPWWPESQ